MLRQNEIICLTETQQKIEKTRFKNSTGSIVTMRRKEEKKGGGLMIMYKKKHVTFEQYVTRNNNLMHAFCKIGSEKFNIILVYMSVDNIVQNKNNMKEIESIINDMQGSYMILGDFNGHLGFLGPHQMNKNGELLYNLINKYNLILLNGHPECTGEITWEQKNKRSVIDYILVNNDMHESFINMNIDDNKEVFDLSDHNMLTATFRRKHGHGNKIDEKQSKKITYMKITEGSKRKFIGVIHQNVTEDTTIEDYETLIVNVRNEHLMKTMRTKAIKHDETQTIWFNKDIEDAIKRRKLYNRQRRNERDTRKQEEFTNLYMMQKKKVQSMVKIEITKHEKKLTEDIKQDKNNKKLWDVINTLRGKMKHDRKDE